ncbi:peptidoglycan-binding protein [Dolichospermum sp. LEGE 00240]|jgi:peptidoglycan hydrolase-like protein with peptidoglycan-binding domain|uniref:peptidoglycan-binding domain-containing protein n=1 Tax=Dolichospermum sp. LEGE 00240 TaxID=1828603 RepID=UPI00187DF8D8|nr:peptidoglycan-binding protein [Dolichospermum sp. LEGE 00240]MDM3848300.1 peptidoglycan-binding domain-containing protein [Aphanizomenon gracile PMC638.10]MDM3849866.1 peptidoglycan-binding domain-containing protein [Aphanizomenon gracile PMC627.10]MDM3855416.1 peptidoglycan-binding domain-containing protein [Aphanizomenon gracile PMC649.10]MDM3861273.1 peptidoglycan-binding domain-containing protein [Aphanizomenon gracile PMC644.10]MBE9250912.1 peptidoglycan-binding protein [Dolichospermum
MKNTWIASIPKMSANCWYSLILLTTTPTLITATAFISTATPLKIAQVNTDIKIDRPPLNMSSQGERVTELQAALKLLGFYSGAVDGKYQQSTVIAVAQFQQAAGLNSTGNVDKITWQKLFPSPSNITATTAKASSFTTVPTQPARVTKPPITKRPTTKNPQNTSIQPTPPNQQMPGIQYTDEGWPILRLRMSGAEVIKLQKQLQNLGFLNGKIDGYFGLSTEAAVKAAQIRYGLKPDGVVGAGTWKVFLKRTSP